MTTMLPRIVLPAVATLGVLYPTSFLLGMWNAADTGARDNPGDWIAGGEIGGGWRYEVYERTFPKTYRMDMSAAERGLGSMCILEVRDGGPRPVAATSGGGPLVFVTLDEPLQSTGQTRIMVDMSEVDRARCAGVISDGQLYAGGAASTRFAAAPRKAPLYALDEPDANLVAKSGAVSFEDASAPRSVGM